MIGVNELIEALDFEVLNRGSRTELDIKSSDINRPGLQLTGFMEYFPFDRPQVLGKVEMTYLDQLSQADRCERLSAYMAYDMPCIIICRNIKCPIELLRLARARDIWVFRSPLATGVIVLRLTNYLNGRLAPRITQHGVLVEVDGVGVMITGSSGVGKSEAALELVKRGHRLVADDVVDIRRVSDNRLVGESPEVVRNFMEIRGIGIIDVASMFGIGSVLRTRSIDLVVHLELWNEEKEYDRLGLTEEFMQILGVRVPRIELPIRPGRNVAAVLEVAARNFRLRQQGYNAARELDRRIKRRLEIGDEE